MLKKTVILIFLAGVFGCSLKAQKEDYIWFFGDSLFLDFNHEPPLLSQTAKAYTHIASGSICDKEGNLLFLCTEQSIIEVGNDTVPGAEAVGVPPGACAYNFDGIMILPVYDTDQHIIFTNSRVYDVSPTQVDMDLSYHVVERNDSSAKFSLTLTNILLEDSLNDGLAAIRHANGQSWWLILHKADSKLFVTYLIDGINFTGPYYQEIGSTVITKSAEVASAIGTISASNDGKRVVLINGEGTLNVFSFDRCSGLFSDWKDASSSINAYYSGAEFSPDGNLLYTVETDVSSFPDTRALLHQYDLNASSFSGSKSLLWSSDSSDYYVKGQFINIELAPDNRLYFTHYNGAPISGTYSMGYIENPDSFNCKVFPESIDLSTYNCYSGLPHYPNYSLGPLTYQQAEAGPDQQICLGDSSLIGISDTSGGKMEWSWWPATGLSDPNAARPLASPSTTTTYYLTATDTTVSAACATTLDSVTVTVLGPYGTHTANAGLDSTICAEESLTLGSSDGSGGSLSYEWTPTTGLSNPNVAMPQATPQSSATYILTVTDPSIHPVCGATVSDTVVITIDPCDFIARFYPNPTDGNSTLFIDGLENGEVLNFELWNMLGQRVIEGWEFGEGTHEVLLDKIESGMYFYRVWREKEIILEDKVILQK